MTIKIEIPSGNEYKPLAAAIGEALVAFANNTALGALSVTSNTHVTSDEKAAITETKKLVETVAEQEFSTVTQTSEVDTASNQSSEEAGNVEASTTLSGESQETSQEQSTVAQGVDAAQGAPSGAADNLDEKGVGFNEQFCGKAAKPFYSSGKDEGQWKKRQGVDKADYDTWYENSLTQVAATETTHVGDTSSAFTPSNQGDNVSPINTATAFNGRQNGEQIDDGQNHQEAVAGGLTFADAGAFMQWLSEQQAAELVTAGDIDSAYRNTGNSMGDLFDPAKSANAIAQVYNFLANIAEGQQ